MTTRDWLSIDAGVKMPNSAGELIKFTAACQERVFVSVARFYIQENCGKIYLNFTSLGQII